MIIVFIDGVVLFWKVKGRPAVELLNVVILFCPDRKIGSNILICVFAIIMGPATCDICGKKCKVGDKQESHI